MTSPHAPVLLVEVIEALDPKPGDVIIDATFGAGGYTRAILERGAEVVALDRDPTVQPFADAVARDEICRAGGVRLDDADLGRGDSGGDPAGEEGLAHGAAADDEEPRHRTNSSATWMALSAAPLRRLSLLRNSTRPLSPSTL